MKWQPAGSMLAAADRRLLFDGAPLWFADEDPAELLRYAPPYGYSYRRCTLRTVKAFQRNATRPRVRRFNSCAVVGNSGSLRLAELGAEIDSHDAVLRVNHAPVAHRREGSYYAPYAGRRTTWRVVTSRWRDQRLKDKDQRLLVICDGSSIGGCQRALFRHADPLAHSVNPRFLAAVRQHTGRSRIPLAGFVAVAIALRTCARVDTYGISAMQHADPEYLGNATAYVLDEAVASGFRVRLKLPPRGPLPRYSSSDRPRVCGYYWHCGLALAGPTSSPRLVLASPGLTSDAAYHRRSGDAAYHDFEAHAQALLRWNQTGQIRMRI